RGRTGRRTAGRVIILVTNDTHDKIYLYASSKRVEKMRNIVIKLNKILKPILRVRPQANPMTQEEILRIQNTIGLKEQLSTSNGLFKTLK
ncbi:MAG: hypothetical protein QW618_02660, partial [Nitrososphaerales archaeon]